MTPKQLDTLSWDYVSRAWVVECYKFPSRSWLKTARERKKYLLKMILIELCGADNVVVVDLRDQAWGE